MCYKHQSMISLVAGFLAYLRAFFRSRNNLALEILALRQQLGVLERKRPRPRLGIPDRIFWVLLRQLWSGWNGVLVIVKPDTVIGWHRAGFRLFWRLRSRARGFGRPRKDVEIRNLIRRMVEENVAWGAPRIHGELIKLGFDISERTVSRYLGRLSRPDKAGQLWLTFLRNHREAIAALDFFAVPTVIFRVLYCLFVIEHGRRKILHFTVTEHPSGEWVLQQLREAFSESCQYRHVILDRDAKFSPEVRDFLTASGLKPTGTSLRSPWQNGVAERWVGSCRREMLDHVIVFNEGHLRRLIQDYISYYHEDRTHDGLGKDTPAMRPAVAKPDRRAHLVSMRRVGGLHHRYIWRQAA